MTKYLLTLTLAFGLASCDDDDPSPTPTPMPDPTPDPDPDPDPTADYDVSYVAHISGDAVLQALGATPFPDGVTAAPPLIMVAHPMGEHLFEEGMTASDGMKLLAETGDSSEAVAEAEAAGFTVLWTMNTELAAFIQMDHPEIELTLEQPCLSFAQMIAPSSDWFIGVDSACAIGEDGNWLDEVVVESVAYDAGTADGPDFMLKTVEGGMDTEPRVAIFELDVAPFSPAGTPVSTLTGVRHVE